MNTEQKLKAAIKALKIYDDCMNSLSIFVGQMKGRCGEQCHNHAVEVCSEAIAAQKILHMLDPASKG